ncbi:MAG: VOC family protein [Vicinamibacterales bacterium]
MEITSHLTFRGECEEAFQFYARVLGGTVTMLLAYGDSPMGESVPPDWRSKIVHANLTVPGGSLSGADLLPEQYEPPRGFFVLLGVDDPNEAERIFAALAQGGEERVPLQQTFWSARFGVVTDRFGVPWEINCAQAGPLKN